MVTMDTILDQRKGLLTHPLLAIKNMIFTRNEGICYFPQEWLVLNNINGSHF